MNKAEVLILVDVIKIAKYLAWHSEIGNEKALSIIEDIHRGKYGDKDGIWVQVNRAMESIYREFSIPVDYSWDLDEQNLPKESKDKEDLSG